MKKKIVTLIGILVLAVFVSGCGAGTTAQPAATTAAAAAQAPASGTGRSTNSAAAQSTPQVVSAKNSADSPAAQSTPQEADGANGASAATPTAVPVPVIVQPTPVPAVQSSANSGTAGAAAPASTAPLAVVTAAPAAAVSAPSLQDLKGKIIFFSDRAGGYPQLYVMNADGSNQQLCNCSDLLPGIVANEVVSPDKQQFLFVKTVGGGRSADIQIWRHNNANNTDEPVTGGAPGFPGVDYQPVWSPDSKHIAWVTETNGFDEIYVYDATQNSNVRLTQSSGEWYKHPSFSPDGSHITYWTNLGNLNYKQIWTMNLDGSAKTNLSNNSYNDWDPIWVK